ncbi:MAG: DUF3137 domain-containing protein [Cyclobacteriaceae bacterium]|nr:DUF3137 domain-containing protein [Cyclobacteriaceae bacterium]
MKTSADFQTFYRSSLVSIVEAFETERKQFIKIIYGYVGLVVFLFLAQVAISIFSDKPGINIVAVDDNGNPISAESSNGGGGFGNIIFLGLIAGGAGYYFWFLPKRSELKKKFKTDIISKIVTFVDNGLHYEPALGISKTEFENSKIFLTAGDRFISEDKVSGTIGSTAVRFSAVLTQRKEVSNDGESKSESWVTIFKGIFFIADFNKDFKGRTVVLTDRAEKTFGSLGTFFQKLNQSRDSLVKLENPEFEKAFAVYSTDAVEAHYILSPSLMERIMSFRKKAGNIELSFAGSLVYIAIPMRENLLEVKIFSQQSSYALLEKYFHQLELVSSLVEELKLNNRIWTKE